MTNQECNQVYWSIPGHYRDALAAMLYCGFGRSACRVLIEQAALLTPPREITEEEASEWYTWRKTLQQMQGRD